MAEQAPKPVQPTESTLALSFLREDIQDLRQDLRQTNERIDQTNERIDGLRTEMNQRMDDLRTEMNERIDDLAKQLDSRYARLDDPDEEQPLFADPPDLYLAFMVGRILGDYLYPGERIPP